jgi:hypothetical protein
MFGNGSLWKNSPKQPVDMGAWVGRQQAFAVIANKCSAAQPLSLKQMKETRGYQKLGLSWDDFCQQHTGIRHRHTDRIIRQCEEFGKACFRLSSPGPYLPGRLPRDRR